MLSLRTTDISFIFFKKYIMQTTIIILIGTAMVITSIVNFAKPAYEQFAGKWDATVNIALSFILGVCSAFAVAPYLEFQLSAGALVLLGLALGTGANLFYDLWALVQNLGTNKVSKSHSTKPE